MTRSLQRKDVSEGKKVTTFDTPQTIGLNKLQPAKFFSTYDANKGRGVVPHMGLEKLASDGFSNGE